MEMMHWWLVKMAAVQMIFLIVAGYGICFLAKHRLVMAKVKVSTGTQVRVRKSPRTGISLR